MVINDFVELTNARDLSQHLSNFCIKNKIKGDQVKTDVVGNQLKLSYETSEPKVA
jgi:hypothetical protein